MVVAGDLQSIVLKRPLSPFIFYSQQARRQIKLENPLMHSKLVMQHVQSNWKRMSAEQK